MVIDVKNLLTTYDLQSAASKIANPAGRLTVVQKGGPENKKVDHRKAVVASYRNNCFFFYNIISYSTTILTVL